jgi:UDPglucose--hexose-1-phosphate uridylyltransferase
MTTFSPLDHPHRRLNPLTGEYVLVSPHRTKRPWQGKQERPPQDDRPAYDPKCYLCPGNVRANGEHNPNFATPFVFTNDYAAVLPDSPSAPAPIHPLLNSHTARGTSRVICFSPRHNLTLPEMSVHEIKDVVDVWAYQTADLGAQYRWVQVFENKGEIMGCSNPHPHGQVWAGDWLPNEIVKENAGQQAYFLQNGRPLLLDYAELERQQGERLVIENDHWMVVVPYWAVWPFETLLLPRRAVQRLPDLSSNERYSLAEILKRLLTRYDNLFEVSFPYSMGWHGAPTDDGDYQAWQLHAHFYPPLLRSSSVKKFMVGYEMMAEAQRDISAEQAADRLRGLSEVHYKYVP